jgi:hypothetical protein
MNYIEKRGSDFKVGDIIPKSSIIFINNNTIIVLKDIEIKFCKLGKGHNCFSLTTENALYKKIAVTIGNEVFELPEFEIIGMEGLKIMIPELPENPNT